MPLIFQPGYKHFWRQTYAAAFAGAAAITAGVVATSYLVTGISRLAWAQEAPERPAKESDSKNYNS